MGKIFFYVFILVALVTSANASNFKPNHALIEVYSESISTLTAKHIYKPIYDKRGLQHGLYEYLNYLDTYKIIFTTHDILAITQDLPTDNNDPVIEVQMIYDLYNLYISRLHHFSNRISTLSPKTANNAQLAKTIAKSIEQLSVQQSDFVYERYLRSQIAQANAAEVPATIRALLEQEIKSATAKPLAYPLYIYLQALAKSFDPHSYLNSSYEESEEHGLIGVRLSPHTKGYKIIDVVEGGAADKAGLKVGDIVLSYKAQTKDQGETISLGALSFFEALSITRDKPNTSFEYIIERQGQKQSVQLTRLPQSESPAFTQATAAQTTEAENKNVSLSFITASDSNIKTPIIRISSFMPLPHQDPRGYPIAQDFMNTLERLKSLWEQDESIQRSIVLDLRGNSGGHTYDAIAVAATFLDHAVIVPLIETNQEGKPGLKAMGLNEEAKQKYTNQAPQVPLVTWVDQSCASSCELLASILQDTGRSLIVGGERTFGKGVGQDVISLQRLTSTAFLDHLLFSSEDETQMDLSLFDSLAVTNFIYYRLRGDTVQTVGLRPDVALFTGQEYSAESMSSKENPIITNLKVPAQSELLKSVDSELVKKLNSRSQERRRIDPFFNVISGLHLLSFHGQASEDASLDMNYRQLRQKELEQLSEGVEAQLTALEEMPNRYTLETAKKNPVKMSATSTAALQELVSISLDYFTAVKN